MDFKIPQNSTTILPVIPDQSRIAELAKHRELIQAVRSVNQAEMLGEDNELSFQFDRDLQRVILRIVNRKTNELIRQIPPENVLQMARELKKQRG